MTWSGRSTGVAVYCASSNGCDATFFTAAEDLGRRLARAGITLVYGGGGLGPMRSLADGALAEGGTVVGVLPTFMYDLEWGHAGLTELKTCEDLHERKKLMIQDADAVVALPGGSGTLEELLEALTFKRLGLYLGGIVIVNMKGFFDPLLELLDRCIEERLMDERHRDMWVVVEEASAALEAIRSSPPWTADARDFATVT